MSTNRTPKMPLSTGRLSALGGRGGCFDGYGLRGKAAGGKGTSSIGRARCNQSEAGRNFHRPAAGRQQAGEGLSRKDRFVHAGIGPGGVESGIRSQGCESCLRTGRWTFGPRKIREMEQFWKRDPNATAISNGYLNAKILEVATYRGDLAYVTTKLNDPEGLGPKSYSSRAFGRINGAWKNLGEERLPSPMQLETTRITGKINSGRTTCRCEMASRAENR